ncbi:MAG TPA: hypothetical protein DCE44_00080, partial [Verrucomicrobiales bacterium]|nr:hypothetical protein [Verrucomicrobiales bacterium]
MPALAAIAESKPRASPAKAARVEANSWDPAMGATAAMPLFLQRMPECELCPLPIQRAASGDATRGSSWGGLTVNVPGDRFEREADRVAEVVGVGTQDTTGPLPLSRVGKPTVQRKCAACEQGASCGECDQEENQEMVQAKPRFADSPAVQQVPERILHPREAGSPLDLGFRRRIEPLLGADLGAVRIHDSPMARDTAEQLGARAFTHRNNIWLGPGHTSSDCALLAHEVTHVVQQNAAPSIPPSAAVLPTVLPVSKVGGGQPQIQRDPEPAPGYLDRALSFGADVAGGALDAGRGAVRAVGDTVKDTALAALRLVSPELAEMAQQGPLEFVKGLVNKALHEWLPALLGGFDPLDAAQEFMDGLGETFRSLAGLLKGEAKSCEGFAKVLDGIRSFGREIMESTVVQTLQDAMTEANAAISKVVKVIAAPVFDAIVAQLGATWKVVSGAAKTVWGWIKSAKDAAGEAWDWAAKKLGLVGAEGEEGVLDWIKRKAGEVWEDIKAALAPAIGPLKKVVIGLGMFTGLGQIYVLVKYGPKLVDAVTWLWEHRNDPDIIRNAREQMKDTILPQLLEAVGGFKGAVDGAAAWLTATLAGLAT